MLIIITLKLIITIIRYLIIIINAYVKAIVLLVIKIIVIIWKLIIIIEIIICYIMPSFAAKKLESKARRGRTKSFFNLRRENGCYELTANGLHFTSFSSSFKDELFPASSLQPFSVVSEILYGKPLN